jgi:hypothetical protein
VTADLRKGCHFKGEQFVKSDFKVYIENAERKAALAADGRRFGLQNLQADSK